MKCKVNDVCQVKNGDLTTRDVAQLLNVDPQWVYDHRDDFEYYEISGRGRNGRELRFDRESVLRYRRERIREAREKTNPYAGKTVREMLLKWRSNNAKTNPYAGKTVEEIARIAKERNRRRNAVGSGS